MSRFSLSHDLNIIFEYFYFMHVRHIIFLSFSTSFRREYLNVYEDVDDDEISLFENDEDAKQLLDQSSKNLKKRRYCDQDLRRY